MKNYSTEEQNKILLKAITDIASCESKFSGDVVDIAQKALKSITSSIDKIRLRDCTSYSRGVDYLDQEFGEDWVFRVSLDELNMRFSENCVLGQLTGDYISYCKDSDPLLCEENIKLQEFVFSGVYDEGFDYEYFTVLEKIKIHTENWKNTIIALRAKRDKLNRPESFTTTNKEEKMLLTFDDESHMIVDSLDQVPTNIRFTSKII